MIELAFAILLNQGICTVLGQTLSINCQVIFAMIYLYSMFE